VPVELPEPGQRLIQIQSGVISRQQAIETGVPVDAIGREVRSGRWLKIHRGVYLVQPGRPAQQSALWAAVLMGGAGAVLSHQTAAEVHGLLDRGDATIHLAIPEVRRVRPVPGTEIHRLNRLDVESDDGVETDGIRLPPCTGIEDTVLDLVTKAATAELAASFVHEARQRQLTTEAKLASAMSRRKRLRWRAEVTEVLGRDQQTS